MHISVVLCTYNRCESLAKTLESAAALTVPDSLEWEILVVDNNSSDQTRKVVEEFSHEHSGCVRYLFEPRPGLSHARNAGIREARGQIIAFLDDDVTLERKWLHNLTRHLHDGEWAGAGGRVFPEWNCPPPLWLSLDQWYALGPLPNFDFGPDACELNEPPFGANMAFRKSVFEKYGGFRTDLGRRPGSLMSNEDTEFGRRLLLAGERLRYEPSAIVYHPVGEDRTKKKYFLLWWFHKGQANIRQFGIRAGTTYFLAGIPLYLFRNLAVWALKWGFEPNPSKRFSNKLKVWTKGGEILECYRKSIEGRKRTGNLSA
ncbi:MAG TPA: glycosyltransferase family A protein [Candidatus Acidoferrum sp.]|nr:glycosyltransferase family A protein [Candidatus Acidoferrum sp.]